MINGTTGIAVGMATNIPTHNPGEVIDAVIACMDRPGISVQKLMDYIPGPDFPTGGIITNASELANIYETGEGKIKVRAKTVMKRVTTDDQHCDHGDSVYGFPAIRRNLWKVSPV